jgi:uncharacterized protein YjbJ (UPF0337 family)
MFSNTMIVVSGAVVGLASFGKPLCTQSHRPPPVDSLGFSAGSSNDSHAKQFAHFKWKNIMNKNQVNGTVKDIVGKAQEGTGKLVGSKEQEAKGIQKQVSGKAEKQLGDAKEVVKDAKDTVKDTVKRL